MLANLKLTSSYAYKWTISPDDDRLLKDVIKEGKEKKIHMRNDWEEFDEDGVQTKVVVMLKAVLEKVEQNEYIRDLLVSTYPRKLVEHTHDKIWGDGLDGSGKNYLGKVLMCVRELYVTTEYQL